MRGIQHPYLSRIRGSVSALEAACRASQHCFALQQDAFAWAVANALGC